MHECTLVRAIGSIEDVKDYRSLLVRSDQILVEYFQGEWDNGLGRFETGWLVRYYDLA